MCVEVGRDKHYPGSPLWLISRQVPSLGAREHGSLTKAALKRRYITVLGLLTSGVERGF